jgi:hypothetical protein
VLGFASALGALPLLCVLGDSVLGVASALGVLPLLCVLGDSVLGIVPVLGALPPFCVLGGSGLGSAAAGEKRARAKSGMMDNALTCFARRGRAGERMHRPWARRTTDTRQHL